MKTTINERVKLLRTQANRSQTEFASDLDMSISIISKVETGEKEVSSRMINQIILVYKVNEDWLLSGKGQLSFERPIKKSETSPWQDILYKELRERISKQDSIIDRLTRVMSGDKSFRQTLNYTGSNKTEQLRVNTYQN